ncbi:hypothetical protein quinque_012592 [Culex quinquefasciatus]
MGSASGFGILLFIGMFLVEGGSVPLEDFSVSDNELELMERTDNWFKVDDEDADMLVPELISKYGYKVESHSVTTEDGYVLKMFRILPREQPTMKKLPVLMVHGLLGSSADFVISGPNHSLAYLLADDGYEVWLANVRGSRYSKAHSTMLIQSKEYWDFTWHEMGYYDLPAMIDHVLNISNSNKLFYIGHSQGTTVYFVMSSSRPEYNDKIALMTALAPAVILKRVKSPILRFMLQTSDTLKKVLDALHIYEFLPHNENNHRIAQILCPPEEKNNACTQIVGLITGPHPEMFDQWLALTYQGHAPAGATTKQMMHFVQLIRSGGQFQQYDYGQKGNLEAYSSGKAPAYNLTASTAPVLIYYGLNDWMVHPRDVETFSKMLPRLVAAIPVTDRKFNHLDFLIAKDARMQVYDKLLPMLDQYSGKR